MFPNYFQIATGLIRSLVLETWSYLDQNLRGIWSYLITIIIIILFIYTTTLQKILYNHILPQPTTHYIHNTWSIDYHLAYLSCSFNAITQLQFIRNRHIQTCVTLIKREVLECTHVLLVKLGHALPNMHKFNIERIWCGFQNWFTVNENRFTCVALLDTRGPIRFSLRWNTLFYINKLPSTALLCKK